MNIGDKVVCINDKPSQHGHKCPAIKGRVYVISEVFTFCGELGINVIGIVLSSRYRGFKSNRFRLLQEMKQEAYDKRTEKA